MASSRIYFGGQLTARLTGLNALCVAVAFALSALKLFDPGAETLRVAVSWHAPFALIFGLLAAIFLWPPWSRWLIRSRRVYHWRMVFALAKIIVALAIWAGLIVSVLLIFPPLLLLALAQVTVSTIYYLILFVFPGGYAARLRDEHAEPTDSPARAEVRTDGRDRDLWNALHIVLASPLIAIAAAGVYGERFARFAPNLAVERLAFESSLLFLVYCAVLGLIAAHFGRLHETGVVFLRSRAVNLVVMPALFCALGVLTFTPAATRGLPDIHARLITPPLSTADMTVTRRVPPEESGPCLNAFEAMSDTFASETPVTICRTPASLWRRLSPGDRVRLTGAATRYGFRYDSVARAG